MRNKTLHFALFISALQTEARLDKLQMAAWFLLRDPELSIAKYLGQFFDLECKFGIEFSSEKTGTIVFSRKRFSRLYCINGLVSGSIRRELGDVILGI